jgi:probable rRNA maturation factor
VILITIQEDFRELITDQILTRAAEMVLHECEVLDFPSLLIRITDDEELKALNLQYRGINGTTDVLSFPADFTDPDLESRYLGDVVIAYPRAAEQAQKRGHFVEAEVQLLVVHGVLHLLGYNHGDRKEKEEMWSLQSRILEKLDLNIEVEDK